METEKDRDEKDKDADALHSEAVRQFRVRQLWEVSPYRHDPETGILNFSQWLEERHPDLFPPGTGQAYQRLRAELIREGEAASATPAAEQENK